MKKRLFLLDIMPLLYRAHFATMGKKFGTTTGIDTRTTLVFFNYVFQIITEEKPDAIAGALDSKPKQRIAVSTEYKANREKMPSEISQAFPYAMQLMEALKIPVLKEEGLEADDVIAAMAKKGAEQGFEVYIVSPDKDFAQLVSEAIFLFRPAYKGAVMETLNITGVKEKYGVFPHQIADFLALRGDSVDNIVGIKGIGDKTAASLLEQFDSVEQLLEKADTIKQMKVRESILESKEQLISNKQLAVLTGDAEVAADWDKVLAHKPDESKLLPLLDELQFVRIKERLSKNGFISSSASKTDIIADAKIQVQELSLEELFAKVLDEKRLAVALFDQGDDLLVSVDGSVFKLQVTDALLLQFAQYCIENGVTVIGWQPKSLLKKLIAVGVEVLPELLDVSLAAYLLDSDAKIDWAYVKDKYELKDFVLDSPYDSLNYLPALQEASEKLIQKLEQMGMAELYKNIELPLLPVLCRMELHGIRIDENALDEIDVLLSKQLKELEKKLYEYAGKKFNIGSPGQTADILQTICEPGELKKTKTGQISTAEPFLTDIAPKYPFVTDLLTYRKLNKIISTYVRSLPGYINRQTDKVHPTFQQVVAGTGRLSCTEPNLQNLPIRNEAGREVRKAVVASQPQFSIVSIDYNQIELRLLPALSGDRVMTETFESGKDIHTTTAMKVFDVDEQSVTKDMRSKAKGVNFGIAYGITPWGLATRLKISQKEAKHIIDAYFEDFQGVQQYLERSVAETRQHGYTKTLYGRVRYIEGINSPNGTTRKIAERMAVNAPLQGLAADIIKDAMVKIDRFITANKLRTTLILQVHDELVFDAADDELQTIIPEISRIMEANSKVNIPLEVNVTVGKNWLEQQSFELTNSHKKL